MDRTPVRYEAYFDEPLHVAIQAVSEVVQQSGGWIVDHSLFSDVVAVLNFVIPGSQLPQLRRHAAEKGLSPEKPPQLEHDRTEDIFGQVRIVSRGGTGDLRRTVPAFS